MKYHICFGYITYFFFTPQIYTFLRKTDTASKGIVSESVTSISEAIGNIKGNRNHKAKGVKTVGTS
jgi:hypothetical protein